MITPESLDRLVKVQYFISIEDSLAFSRVKLEEKTVVELLKYFSGNESLDYLIEHHVFIRIKKSTLPFNHETALKICVSAWLDSKHATYYQLRWNNNSKEITARL